MKSRKKFGKISRLSNDNGDIDITSLLDILVILLFFLLNSYNPTDLDLSMIANLTLPKSDSKKFGEGAIIVQVNRFKEIWIDNKKIADILDNGNSQDGDNDKIQDLYNELQQASRNLASTESNKQQFENNINVPSKENKKPINILIDKSLTYNEMQKIMHTSYLAGFSNFKFIVQTSE